MALEVKETKGGAECKERYFQTSGLYFTDSADEEGHNVTASTSFVLHRNNL